LTSLINFLNVLKSLIHSLWQALSRLRFFLFNFLGLINNSLHLTIELLCKVVVRVHGVVPDCGGEVDEAGEGPLNPFKGRNNYLLFITVDSLLIRLWTQSYQSLFSLFFRFCNILKKNVKWPNLSEKRKNYAFTKIKVWQDWLIVNVKRWSLRSGQIYR